ncbi:DUF1439 domain-containing protein [Rhodoferax koreense]|uniref:DUF1439 domain-containing protein n=1 Tax=Rhodoferax koreensis TaxID=1842727 RepID=A0A1P8K1Y0_9BURK|nr:DUF1439 domain-containing protein [Rhodoferax koreense]APW40005.1 DUF1439 domain-containing protein [Rhodoferax koreense]
MHRRHCLRLAGRAALLAGGWVCAIGAQAQPRYTVSPAQLQAAVAEKFPLRYPVAGLFDLALQAPRLKLLPAVNRINADMPVEAAGEALRRRYSGNFDLDFALRYEASDKTLRAYQIQVNALRFPGLRPEVSEMLNAYAPVLAAQALREVVLHQFTAKDLAMADTMGLEPAEITVTAQGLVIGFRNK